MNSVLIFRDYYYILLSIRNNRLKSVISTSFLNRLRNISSVTTSGDYDLHLEIIRSPFLSASVSNIFLYYATLLDYKEPYLVAILADLINITTTHINNSVNDTAPLLSL